MSREALAKVIGACGGQEDAMNLTYSRHGLDAVVHVDGTAIPATSEVGLSRAAQYFQTTNNLSIVEPLCLAGSVPTLRG